ncbi:MAG: post-COAP-1 domain-containing protein [Pyrinomonadaceae bacterium]
MLPLWLTQASTPGAGTIGPNGPTQTWTGPPTGGAAANESSCVEGVNCDTFALTVSGAPADYAGKTIGIKIAWTIPANDYDLYIHYGGTCPATGACSGPVVASSGDGAPEPVEETAIDPGATGTGVYYVRAIYFSVTPGDPYTGTAEVRNAPQGRNANYLKTGVSFSPNVTVKAPVAAQDGEPSNRTDKFGNHYTGAIRGVPAGVDLWYFDLQPGSPTYDPKMRNPIWRGQPDSFTQDDATSVGADGGGDIDLAVGFDSPTGGGPPTLAYSSLVAANISVGKSTDKGQTFQLNPLGNLTGGAPGDDRQWHEFLGGDKVYLLYRTLAPAVTMIQRSNDGGLTYGPAKTAGAIGQVGSIDVHQATGTVYISGSTGQVCVGTPPAATPLDPQPEPLTYTCNQAALASEKPANIFFTVKVADDGTPNGTAYVVYSDGSNIYIRHSTDKGATWSPRVRVSDGMETRTSLLPWIETGPTPGSVGIVWYGTTEPTNNDSANWQMFFAQSFNADENAPTFRQVVASDHFIHGSNISTGGTLGTANRNLLDYFQLSFDPTGAAVISYTDDHNDFSGHTYVTRQVAGPSIRNEGTTTVPAPIQGASLAPGPQPASPPAQPGPNGEQITDFAQDVATGLLVVTPTNDPLDITSIKYSCEGSAANPVIVAQMKVSDLSTVPAGGNWRMNFTANAPNSKLSPTGDYTFGLSDRGDQFWVRASTDPSQTSPFSFGTAVRNSDGTLTYTRRGAADSGTFDTATNTITVKVSASKLNPFVTKGPAVAAGSILVGLRGQTFTAGANAKRDLTRGGTQYTIGCGTTPTQTPTPSPTPTTSPTPTPSPSPTPTPGPVDKATGGGHIVGKTVNFGFNADALPSGHLNYTDKEQNIHLVSDAITTFTQTGPNAVMFTGRGRVGSQMVEFTVWVEDNGEPGTNDYFKIVITGGVVSTREGRLTTGNIQFHR